MCVLCLISLCVGNLEYDEDLYMCCTSPFDFGMPRTPAGGRAGPRGDWRGCVGRPWIVDGARTMLTMTWLYCNLSESRRKMCYNKAHCTGKCKLLPVQRLVLLCGLIREEEGQHTCWPRRVPAKFINWNAIGR